MTAMMSMAAVRLSGWDLFGMALFGVAPVLIWTYLLLGRGLFWLARERGRPRRASHPR